MARNLRNDCNSLEISPLPNLTKMSSFVNDLAEMANKETNTRELWDKMKSFQDIKTLRRDETLANEIIRLDDQLYNGKTKKTLIGEAIKIWLNNPEETNARKFMYKLVKMLIKNDADFVRSLMVAINEPTQLSFMLRLIVSSFPEKPTAKPYVEKPSQTDTRKRKDFLDKAVKNPTFIRAIRDLYNYNLLRKSINLDPKKKDENLDDLKEMDVILELRQCQANPYVHCLLFFLKTSDYVSEEMENDVLMQSLKLSSELRNQSCQNSYLETHLKHLSKQVENVAVEIVDEVQDKQELDLVMQMDDRDDPLLWIGTNMNKITLLQHAVNLRCKSFVASRKCQYLMEKIVFGEYFQFWNAEKAGVPVILLLLLKTVGSVFVWLGMIISWLILKPLLCVCCWCSKSNGKRDPENEVLLPYEEGKQKILDVFQEFLELPCQRYLFDLCCHVFFLGLIISTAFEENFGPNNKHLCWGLSIPDIGVLMFALLYLLRSSTKVIRHISVVIKNPGSYRRFRFILPGVISLVHFCCCVLIVTAISIWVSRWEKYRAWKPRDPIFLDTDIIYSVALLLAFTRLAHFYKAQEDIGRLFHSMYLVLIRDVVYFSFIFVTVLFIPFATGLRKMYSYYVTEDITRNATQPLASIEKAFGILFWTLMGADEKNNLDVSVSNDNLVKDVGLAFIGAFVVTGVVVGINMLIATMNHTYEEVMKDAEKEFVFVRTSMWLEYIDKDPPICPKCSLEDYDILPPPLNILHDVKVLFQCCRSCCKKTRKKIKSPSIKTTLQERLVIRYLWRSLGLKEDYETLDNTWSSIQTGSQAPEATNLHSYGSTSI